MLKCAASRSYIGCITRYILILFFMMSSASIFATTIGQHPSEIADAIVDYVPNNFIPSYENNSIKIPRIDTKEKIGIAQNLHFQYNEKNNSWDLLKGEISAQAPINQVSIISTDSFPVQFFLKIKIPTYCQPISVIHQRIIDNKFEIVVNFIENIAMDCPIPTIETYEEKIVPLSVYGLSAGNYGYSVNNGKFVGTFSLVKDNILTPAK